MKKQIIIILVFLLAVARVAQAQELVKGSYYPQPELDKFEGEWVYNQQGKTLKLILKNEKVYLDRIGVYMDQIQGYYSYAENNQVVESSVGKEKSIVTGSFDNDAKTKITFLFEDLNKNKRGNGSLELLPGKTDEARWKLTNTEGVRVGEYDYTFSVPTQGVMKKVK